MDTNQIHVFDTTLRDGEQVPGSGLNAKQKVAIAISLEELGVDISNRIEVLEVNDPPARDAGVMVSSAAELVEKLKNEAKVI